MKLRVVFDTNTVISALLFANGRLAWLRPHWRSGAATPLISSAVVSELMRVLAYPKFKLNDEDRLELMGDYLPFCETVKVDKTCPAVCRDANDQPFLNLAQSGRANLLVTGDQDLLTLVGQTRFTIETPEDFRQRFAQVE